MKPHLIHIAGWAVALILIFWVGHQAIQRGKDNAIEAYKHRKTEDSLRNALEGAKLRFKALQEKDSLGVIELASARAALQGEATTAQIWRNRYSALKSRPLQRLTDKEIDSTLNQLFK